MRVSCRVTGQKNEKGCIITQDIIANFFTFSDANGTIQINYYPHTRLEYQGPEGKFVYPGVSPGRENMTVQEQSLLGQQVNVVLVPSVDGTSVTLTLLLPSMNMAVQNESVVRYDLPKAVGIIIPSKSISEQMV